jgi:dethiobiotin synthetase
VSTLLVTGTGTGVGKTVVTAAIAALAAAADRTVAVVKLAQTGVLDSQPGDLDVVQALSGVSDMLELARYPDPLAPATAARRAGLPQLPAKVAADRIHELADRDLVLVEGAGGLLVHLNDDEETAADVAGHLHAGVVVVCPAGLGTLNEVALTAEALRSRDLDLLGLVVGSFPAHPDLASQTNLEDLPRYARAPLLGRLPAGLGTAAPAEFLAAARAGLAPALGGQCS